MGTHDYDPYRLLAEAIVGSRRGPRSLAVFDEGHGCYSYACRTHCSCVWCCAAKSLRRKALAATRRGALTRG